MVLPLGPGKFYGTSLPRPRIYTDVKFSDERVDPPTPVNDPLLSWANDAHWSMGGLSFNRLRLQGKIEGNVKKLRIEQEKSLKNSQTQTLTPQKSKSSGEVKKKMKKKGVWRKSVEDSPPPAPVSRKMKLRSRTVSVEDDDEDEDVEEEMGTVRQKRRRLMRKLGDEFEMVAGKSEKSAEKTVTTTKGGPKTRGRKMVLTEEEEEEVEDEEEGTTDAGTSDECVAVSPNGKRSSPRLMKKLK